MRNTLGDLNNHLFIQLEKLSDEDLKGEELKEEVTRTKAISLIAKQIIDNGTLVLEAKKVAEESLNADIELPKMLEGWNHEQNY